MAKVVGVGSAKSASQTIHDPTCGWSYTNSFTSSSDAITSASFGSWTNICRHGAGIGTS